MHAGISEDQEYFEFDLIGFTPFQVYEFEVFAENTLGTGESAVTKEKIHFLNRQIESLEISIHVQVITAWILIIYFAINRKC